MTDPGDDAIDQCFAENLRVTREHQGISQAALARAMKARGHPWHQATVARIESGVQPVGLKEAKGIAVILGVPLDKLTWPVAENAELLEAAGAISRLRTAAEDAAAALLRLYEVRDAAETAARRAGKSRYERVRDTGRHIAGELEDATVQNVLAESGKRWKDETKGHA